jgi:RNA polymerase sigma-70 factor (ECF subfamily)
MASPGQVTLLLQELSRGNTSALDELLPLVYTELHAIAARYLNRQRRDHTLQATALINEAYLRLIGQQRVDWQGRLHFLSVAAMMMRRILINHARHHHTLKRGALQRIPLDDAVAVCEQRSVEMLAIDDALCRLAAMDAQQAQLVELRFFGGLSIEETAQVLGISPASVKRKWNSARAWLYAEITKGTAHESGTMGAS